VELVLAWATSRTSLPPIVTPVQYLHGVGIDQWDGRSISTRQAVVV
jgi:hypothetical protein